RQTVPELLATQTAPAPYATATGRRATRIVNVAYEPESILVTVSSPVFATQTAESPKAMLAGPSPTEIVRTAPSSKVEALKRPTFWSPRFATQRASCAYTRPTGLDPARPSASTRTDKGSTRASV